MSEFVYKYVNYKISHLLKCASIVTFENEFLTDCFRAYFNLYANNYYYHKFETVDGDFCDINIIKEEFDGKEVELLEDLANYEFELSNDDYLFKKNYIMGCKNIGLFLVQLDLKNFFVGADFKNKINEYIDFYPNISKMIGTNRAKFIDVIEKHNRFLEKFFMDDNFSYQLNYCNYKDRDNFVKLDLYYEIEELKADFKRSLVRRVFNLEKLDKLKFELLVSKFVKTILYNDFYGKENYEKYFIEIPSSLFKNVDELKRILTILNNKFISKSLVVSVKHEDYINNRKLFEEFSFVLGCSYNFSLVEDINVVLGELDNNYNYSYILVDGYKTEDYDWFYKYKFINIDDVLFIKE